jgi:hypothetical protein
MGINKELVNMMHEQYRSRKLKRRKYPNIPLIVVRYWHSERSCPNVGIKDTTHYYNASERKRNAIINRVIASGYNVMIQTITPSEGDAHQIIWIDDKRFGQR